MLCDAAAMKPMGLYTLTQSPSVKLMAISMLNLFQSLSVMLRHCRRVKVIIFTTALIIILFFKEKLTNTTYDNYIE